MAEAVADVKVRMAMVAEAAEAVTARRGLLRLIKELVIQLSLALVELTEKVVLMALQAGQEERQLLSV